MGETSTGWLEQLYVEKYVAFRDGFGGSVRIGVRSGEFTDLLRYEMDVRSRLSFIGGDWFRVELSLPKIRWLFFGTSDI